ncbi:MAG TPA: Clp protease N-terminal domain-containing protein [Streptosporangiaceae bacterium]|jgi:ATP-dependent Clp protease ATP-binding subunit ClpC
MPKVNIYLPDDLAEAVKDADVPVSAVCQRALEHAVRRVTAVREITAGPLPAGLTDHPVVNFTRRAMTVLRSAQAAAQAEQAGQVHTGHLLAGLLADGRMAVHVLTALDITPRQVSADLASRGPDRGGALSSGDAAAAAEAVFSPEAAAALELAMTESSGLGNHYVGSEHLLLGLISEPHGVAGQVLRSLGADPRVTRRTVAAALAGWGAAVEARQDGGEQAGLAAAVRSELQPLLDRIDRLEHLVGS